MSTGETADLDLNGDLSKFFYDQELSELAGALETGDLPPEALSGLLK